MKATNPIRQDSTCVADVRNRWVNLLSPKRFNGSGVGWGNICQVMECVDANHLQNFSRYSGRQ